MELDRIGGLASTTATTKKALGRSTRDTTSVMQHWFSFSDFVLCTYSGNKGEKKNNMCLLLNIVMRRAHCTLKEVGFLLKAIRSHLEDRPCMIK